MREAAKQSGRSLAELLIVLAIIGIVATMAWPTYQAVMLRNQARNAAAEIASSLRMARHLAMARRERLLVRFDTAQKTITLERADAEGTLNVYRYGDKGITLNLPSVGPDIFFHPSGRSASASTIVLYDGQGRATTLTVSISGRVVIL